MTDDERAIREAMEAYAETQRLNRIGRRVFICMGALLLIAIIASAIW